MPNHSTRCTPLMMRAMCAAAFIATLPASAQTDTKPPDGLSDAPSRFVAITGASVWQANGQGAGRWLENGTVVMKNGRIVSVAAAGSVPAGATEIKALKKRLLPGFIDLASSYGASTEPCGYGQPAAGGGGGRMPRALRGRGASTPMEAESSAARYWNPMVCAERDGAAQLMLDAETGKALRGAGFTTVLTAPTSGVWRGSSALLALRAEPTAGNSIIRANVAQAAAMERTSPFSGNYPASTMGAIALLRQSLFDAQWYQKSASYALKSQSEAPAFNAALAALQPVLSGTQSVFWQTDSELDYQRVLKISAEFKLRPVLLGNGYEYRMQDVLKASNAPLVLPIAFPEAPAVSDPEIALDVALADLEHWRYAPFNPKLLANAGIEFSLSTRGLEKPGEEFLSNLRKAVRYGLSEAQAITALTQTPARTLGLSSELGQIAPGQRANLLIVDADFLSAEKAKLYEVYVDGEREVRADLNSPDFAGTWSLTLPGGAVRSIDVKGQGEAAKVSLPGDKTAATDADKSAKPDDKKADSDKKETIAAKFYADRAILQVPSSWLGSAAGSAPEQVAITAQFVRDASGLLVSDRWTGSYLSAQGKAISWSAQRSALGAEKPDDDASKPLPNLPAQWRYPAGEFGLASKASVSNAVVIRNATVWLHGFDTAGKPLNPLKNTDVLVQRGKISAVGTKLNSPANAQEIDGSNLHITPGIVDAHSHVAVDGDVNEGTHTVTSEVRIADVLDPTDINIYRQLAGGVTTSHLMHGSANAIGGQSQVVKFRWGLGADALKFTEAAPTIKFALGENPKQANWGDQFVTRYPQTRMGVEQLIRDSYQRADAYAAAANEAAPRRRDLRLDALVEVLAKQRMLHVHSYRQDEILMFARMMQQRKVPIAAFQHVLEGYKVADVLAEVGAGASTFADWWAFKVEVQDAIPYNAGIMMKAGVLTSLNSDSPDTARRLNTEAAKTVRFGGLSESEALSLVTINPAKQLRVDQFVGSIEAGKHADLVIWSANPLSTQARVLQTWIDGARYFDLATHETEVARIASARAELIQAAISDAKPDAGAGGKPGKSPGRPMFFALQPNQWPSDLSTRRSLYHDGQPAHQCTRAALEQAQ